MSNQIKNETNNNESKSNSNTTNRAQMGPVQQQNSVTQVHAVAQTIATIPQQPVQIQQSSRVIPVTYKWVIIDEELFPNITLPLIIRDNVQYASVRIIEKIFLNHFETVDSQEIRAYGNLNVIGASESEAAAFNEANEAVDKNYGHENFKEGANLVKLNDFKEFYEILRRTCPCKDSVKKAIQKNIILQYKQKQMQSSVQPFQPQNNCNFIPHATNSNNPIQLHPQNNYVNNSKNLINQQAQYIQNAKFQNITLNNNAIYNKTVQNINNLTHNNQGPIQIYAQPINNYSLIPSSSTTIHNQKQQNVDFNNRNSYENNYCQNIQLMPTASANINNNVSDKYPVISQTPTEIPNMHHHQTTRPTRPVYVSSFSNNINNQLTRAPTQLVNQPTHTHNSKTIRLNFVNNNTNSNNQTQMHPNLVRTPSPTLNCISPSLIQNSPYDHNITNANLNVNNNNNGTENANKISLQSINNVVNRQIDSPLFVNTNQQTSVPNRVVLPQMHLVNLQQNVISHNQSPLISTASPMEHSPRIVSVNDNANSLKSQVVKTMTPPPTFAAQIEKKCEQLNSALNSDKILNGSPSKKNQHDIVSKTNTDNNDDKNDYNNNNDDDDDIILIESDGKTPLNVSASNKPKTKQNNSNLIQRQPSKINVTDSTYDGCIKDGFLQIDNKIIPFICPDKILSYGVGNKVASKCYKYIPCDLLFKFGFISNELYQDKNKLKNRFSTTYRILTEQRHLEKMNELIENLKQFDSENYQSYDNTNNSLEVINLFEFIFFEKRAIFLKRLAIENPFKCLISNFSEILTLTGGILMIKNENAGDRIRLLPFIKLESGQILAPSLFFRGYVNSFKFFLSDDHLKLNNEQDLNNHAYKFSEDSMKKKYNEFVFLMLNYISFDYKQNEKQDSIDFGDFINCVIWLNKFKNKFELLHEYKYQEFPKIWLKSPKNMDDWISEKLSIDKDSEGAQTAEKPSSSMIASSSLNLTPQLNQEPTLSTIANENSQLHSMQASEIDPKSSNQLDEINKDKQTVCDKNLNSLHEANNNVEKIRFDLEKSGSKLSAYPVELKKSNANSKTNLNSLQYNQRDSREVGSLLTTEQDNQATSTLDAGSGQSNDQNAEQHSSKVPTHPVSTSQNQLTKLYSKLKNLTNIKSNQKPINKQSDQIASNNNDNNSNDASNTSSASFIFNKNQKNNENRVSNSTNILCKIVNEASIKTMTGKESSSIGSIKINLEDKSKITKKDLESLNNPKFLEHLKKHSAQQKLKQFESNNKRSISDIFLEERNGKEFFDHILWKLSFKNKNKDRLTAYNTNPDENVKNAVCTNKKALAEANNLDLSGNNSSIDTSHVEPVVESKQNKKSDLRKKVFNKSDNKKNTSLSDSESSCNTRSDQMVQKSSKGAKRQLSPTCSDSSGAFSTTQKKLKTNKKGKKRALIADQDDDLNDRSEIDLNMRAHKNNEDQSDSDSIINRKLRDKTPKKSILNFIKPNNKDLFTTEEDIDLKQFYKKYNIKKCEVKIEKIDFKKALFYVNKLINAPISNNKKKTEQKKNKTLKKTMSNENGDKNSEPETLQKEKLIEALNTLSSKNVKPTTSRSISPSEIGKTKEEPFSSIYDDDNTNSLPDLDF